MDFAMAENSCALNDQFRDNILQPEESLQSYLGDQPASEAETPADSLKEEERLSAELDEDDDHFSFSGSDEADLSDLISDKEMNDENSNSNPTNTIRQTDAIAGSYKSTDSEDKEISNDAEDGADDVELSEESDESDGERDDDDDDEDYEDEEEGDDYEEDCNDEDTDIDDKGDNEVEDGGTIEHVEEAMDTDHPEEEFSTVKSEPVATPSPLMPEPSQDQPQVCSQKPTTESVEKVEQVEKEGGTGKKRTRTTDSGSKKKKRKVTNDKQKQKKQRNRKKNSSSKKERKKKSAHERKNIRDILKEDELESETVAAQAAELERRKRLMDLRDEDTPEEKETTELPEKDSELRSLLQAAEVEVSASPNDDIIFVESEEDKQKTVAKPPPPVQPDDVITLSSDDEEDDTAGRTGSQESSVARMEDDEEDEELCAAQEDEDEAAENPNDSGFHINDCDNQPDFQGRVLVNVKHPGEDHDIFLAPQIARVIKPHQIGGIRFLYDNLVESLSRFQSSSGFGCILAHSMGLGKTIQLVAFIDVFLRETTAKTVLCIVPINTLQNWMSEFNMWLPTPGSDNLRVGDRPRNHKVYLLNDSHKTMSARASVIENWCITGGVLLMGYEMYRLLCSRKNPIYQKPKKPKKCAKPEIIDLEEEDRNKLLLVDIQSALVRPGPDLVVCDEGHRIKNSHAGISQSLKNIRTKRRVVLTGYPLQNNLLEYWCMVDFVRPNYLGSKTEFCNMFERPIMNGQCMDSTVKDIKIMRYRAHVLHSLLEGFVQRRGHTVLRYNLPPKQEFVFLVKLSPIQRAVYKQFMECIESGTEASWETTNPLKAFSVCCKIWSHPDVLHKVLAHKRMSAADDNDLDIDTESKANGEANKSKKKKRVNNLPSDESYGEKNVISYDWAEPVMKDYQEGLLESGAKVLLLFEILEKTLSLGEKMLVFSQSLFTLNIIEEFLSKRKVPRPSMDEYWCRNKNYFRLDGATAGTDREKLINQFNAPDNDRVWLFLLSTRAGSLGINLIGANRVVVMDASWNPCHDCQAVCRVYRYGQQRNCYVYRLVSENTLEKKIYERQINKQGMSDRVVDELNPENNFTRGQVESLLHYEDKDFPPPDISKIDETFDDEVLIHTLKKHSQWITQLPFTHESLLIDKKELRLSKQDKRLAKQSYAMEKKLNVSYSRPSYAAYYPKYGQGPRFNPRGASPKHTRPIASVKPIMSTPVPIQSHPVLGPSSQSTFPLQQLVRPGVSVHQVITTTDIVLPGSNTASNARPVNRIAAGQNVLVIKTTKGVYIRTSDGKIFAVRSRADQQSIQKEISSQTTSANRQMTTPTTTTNSMAGNINPLVGMAKQVERTLQNRGDPSASKNCDLLANIYAQTATVNSLLSKKPFEMDISSKTMSQETLSNTAAPTQPPRPATKVMSPVPTGSSSNLSTVIPFEVRGSPKTFTSNSNLSNSLFDDDEASSESDSLGKSCGGNNPAFDNNMPSNSLGENFGGNSISFDKMPSNSLGENFGGNPISFDNKLLSNSLGENPISFDNKLLSNSLGENPISFDNKLLSNSLSQNFSGNLPSFDNSMHSNLNQNKNLNLVTPFKSTISNDRELSGSQQWPIKPFESDFQPREEAGNNTRPDNQIPPQASPRPLQQQQQTTTTTASNTFPVNRRFETEWSSGITSSPSDLSRESRDLDFDSRSLGDIDKVLRVLPQRPASDFLSDSQDSQSSERSQDLSSSVPYNMSDSNQGYNAPLPPFTQRTSSVPYNIPLTSSMMMPSMPDFSAFPSMSNYPVQRSYNQYPMPSYSPYVPHPHSMLLPQPNLDVPTDSYHHYGQSQPFSQHTVNMDTLSGSNVLSLPPYPGSPVSDILSIPPSHHKSSSSSSKLPVSQDNSMM